MFKEIIDQLRCPICKESLQLDKPISGDGEIIENTLVCVQNHQWPISEGVLDFHSKEQTLSNNWSEMYKKHDYETLDKLVMDAVPDVQKESYDVACQQIIQDLRRNDVKTVIDIATGRGMLMKEVVRHLDVQLTCVDLSFPVLKYDRLKALKINPKARVNFIACDATNLPFVDGSVDQAISFFGITNMGEFARTGIQETLRVTNHQFINAGLVIKDDNPKIETLNTLYKEQGHDIDLNDCSVSKFETLHTFENTHMTIEHVFEGIAGKSTHDAVPIEDEWFAIALCKYKRG